MSKKMTPLSALNEAISWYMGRSVGFRKRAGEKMWKRLIKFAKSYKRKGG